MELKVWVDGIQRVVCGASYSTTCQDVVLALASAMGRTGRFTLVEKWRDSERPLFPNEYPLQSLHKWGEYAGEIRFLLVHAETDLNKQQDLGQQRKKSQVQTANSVVNRNNPPEPSQRHLSEVESLKRSSTFSCALRTNFAALPSSLSSGQKSASLSQPTYYQQSSISGSTSSIRPHPTGLVSVPNGKVTPLSSVSSSDSSPRSSSTSLRYHPQSKLFSGQSSEQRPIPSARGDARELHPANMPDASSSYSVQTKDFPYYSTAFNQYSSSSSTIVPSRQLQPPIQHPHPRHLSRPDPLPSTQVHQTHSTFRVPSSALLGSQSLHSQQPQQSNPQRLQSQKPYPQHDKSEYVLSDQSHQSDGSQQYFHKSDHSQLYAKSGQSQHYFPPSGQSQQLNYIRPDVQRQLSSSSEEHTKITSPNLKQHKERAHYRKSHSNKSDAPSAESQNPTRPVVNYAKSKLNNDSLIENTKYRRLNDRVIDDDGVNDLHNGSNHLQSENSSHKIQNSYNSSTQEKLPPKGSIELHTDNRPATLDRRNTRPKVNKELPSRSLSTGDQSDKQKENYLHPEFGLNQHIQGEGGNGLTHEDSSTLRQQKSSTGVSNSKLSSFTSAVAYIRNHSDSVKSFKPTINNLSSKADSQTGQRILDNSQVHGSNGREVFHSGTATSEATQPLDNKSGSITNGHSIPPHLQTSVTPPVSFNLISTFQHKSAFSEVSPKSSHHEISPLPSVPVRLNPDQANVLDNNYQRQNNQTSLEVEEYDLDQNFPDILHGQVPVTRHADGDYGLTTFLKERLEHGVKSSQAEGERMQLLRTVQVQQERIKTQEAQIDDASVEIAALEQEESGNQAKLEALASEICQLEKQEAEVRVELEDLEATDWLNAVSVEQRRESDIKIQLTSIQEKQAQIEAQVKQLFAEADHKSKELELEEQRINQENKNNEELEKKAHLQIAELTDQLTSLDKAVDEKSRRLSDIEAKILEMDATLGQKEEMVKAIKKELQVENLEVLQPSPLPKEQVSNDVPAVSIPPSPIGPMSTSDNGEAILKILEGRLSPRSTSFPSGDGGDSLEGVTSAQHNYKSAMAVKNPNGVWV